MASYLTKINRIIVSISLRKLQKKCKVRLCSTMEFEELVDNLTTNLIQKHTCKRDLLQVKSRLTRIAPIVKSSVVNNSLDEVIVNAVRTDDMVEFEKLIANCRIGQQCPSKEAVAQILVESAFKGKLEVIEKLKELYENVEPNVLECNASFNHFLAEATWRRGNINKSLQLFEETYTNYEYCRNYLRRIVNHLFLNKLTENSEAHMRSVIAFSERLSDKFGDIHFLITVWQICFLSEWYADQCTAMNMLERNQKLYEAASNRLPLLVRSALDNHHTENVYRLLEFLIKKDAKLECTFVLEELFNYKFHQKDLRSCCEIVRWSREHSIPLAENQIKQYFQLTISNDFTKTDKTAHSNTIGYKYKF